MLAGYVCALQGLAGADEAFSLSQSLPKGFVLSTGAVDPAGEDELSSPPASPQDSSLQGLSVPPPPCRREPCRCQGAQHRNRPVFVLGSGAAEGPLELLLKSLFTLPAQFLSSHGIRFSSPLDLRLRREILACKSLIPSRTVPYQVLGSGAWLFSPLFAGLLQHPTGLGCPPPPHPTPRYCKPGIALQNKQLCFSASQLCL